MLEHDFQCKLVFFTQMRSMAQEDAAAPFEISPFRRQHVFLDSFPYVFKSPCHIADDMETVDDDRSFREEGTRNIKINTVHIHDEISDIPAVRKALDIIDQGCLGAVREDIQDLMAFRIREDRLELSTAGIPAELIDGEDLRERRRFWVLDVI